MMQHNESLLPQSFLEYLILFVIIVGVFVIAWFYSKLLNTKKLSDEVKRFENENHRLKQTFRAHNDSISLEENLSVIRAKRTRDRFGVLAKEDTDTNQFSLDLDNSEDSKKPIPKDDLTKIIELDTAIEEQLNAMGLVNYEQMSELNIEQISVLNEALSTPIHRIKKWVKNAKELREN